MYGIDSIAGRAIGDVQDTDQHILFWWGYLIFGPQVSREDALCRTDPIMSLAGVPGLRKTRPADADIQNFIAQLEWRKLSHGFPQERDRISRRNKQFKFWIKTWFSVRVYYYAACLKSTPWVQPLPKCETEPGMDLIQGMAYGNSSALSCPLRGFFGKFRPCTCSLQGQSTVSKRSK